MAKSQPQFDVLVLGNHPSAYFAAAVAAQVKNLRVGLAELPGQPIIDRLVLINPDFFELHAITGSLKRKLDLTPMYGLRFLGDDPGTSSSSMTRTIGAYVGSFKQVHAAMVKAARAEKVSLHSPREVNIVGLDESGVTVELERLRAHATVLIVAGDASADQKRQLGLPLAWDEGVMHRYTFARLKGQRRRDKIGRPAIPMSLDLRGTMRWAWLLEWKDELQIAVEQPLGTTERDPPALLLKHWMGVLAKHGVLGPEAGNASLSGLVSMDLPLAGALTQEGVANRSLLIGPAGGFYTACAEDVYPNCWSAIHAVDVAAKALKERHLQDALQPYRQRWGSTLGDYLRGPQQNLRFLLPLVYRNPTMAARLAEAILLGRSVVR